MMKKRVGIFGVIICIVLVGVMLVVRRSIVGDLKSHAWNFDGQWVNTKATATFKRNKMILITAGVRETYRYKVYKQNNQHYIKMTGKNGVTGKKETQIFTIERKAHKFVMRPTNVIARENFGRVILSRA